MESLAPPSMRVERLLPALLECFGIMACGYGAGLVSGVMAGAPARGLGVFVSRFALPALLFRNMVLLDFGGVVWPFFFSVLVAKAAVFLLVGVVTLLVTDAHSRFAKAGLFPIFATQSNDFALGFPIVDALYRSTHPEYLQYIYLLAPVSLMLLNPLGFALCEVQRWRGAEPRSRLKALGLVLLRVLKNPMVFMVGVGLVSHFLLEQKIPPFMEPFINGLADSFGGAALFYLGLTMVGQLKKLTRSTLVALILLLTAKLLVMPLISRGMVELLDRGNTSSANHSSLSNYAFLYGLFPTAPSVAIYAAHYNMELEVVTSGMVVGTFLSAPLMYVSAWLLSVPWMDAARLAPALQSVSLNVSIVSLFALVWSLAVMFLSRKFRRVPQVFTTNLLVAQFLACVGMIAWSFVSDDGSFLSQVLSFALLYGSLYTTYLWPGLIALSLLLLRTSDQQVWTGPIIITGWGVPLLLVSVVLLCGEKMPGTVDSAFFYGETQVACTSALLCVSISVCGVSLTLLSRHTHTHGEEEEERTHTPAPPSGSINTECQTCDCGRDQLTDDTFREASAGCGSTHCLLAEEELRAAQRQETDVQAARHVLMSLLLAVALMANLSSCLWWLLSLVPGRLYLELQFFCVLVNYGQVRARGVSRFGSSPWQIHTPLTCSQGLLSFVFFGLDEHLIVSPFKRRWASLWGAWRPEEAGPGISEEQRLTCSQFLTYHKENCVRDILQQKRCGETSVTHTFLGCDLVAWLQSAGLAGDQGEALAYGARLLEGGVIQHISGEQDFQDRPLHYRFT